MNYIEHIVEPDTLLLSWQTRDGATRMRMFVAKLVRNGEDANLEYFDGSEEFIKATDHRFECYPGYTDTQQVHKNILGSFLRRIPPRKRKDFDRFLNALRINPEMKDDVSDFALLGYSQARLPSDDFTIIHPFSNAHPPFELLVEVQGYRYLLNNFPYEKMTEGLTTTFKPEPENPKDPEAIAIQIEGTTIGYVCRGLLKSFHNWIANNYNISASIERINSTPEKPRVFVFVFVR